MNRTLRTLLPLPFFLFLCGLWGPLIHAQGVDIQLDFVSQTVEVGDVFNVAVNVVETAGPGTQQINGVDVHLNFDPTILNVLSLTPGTSLNSVLVSAGFDNALGTAEYAAGTLQNLPQGTFTHLTIEFEAVGAGVAVLEFNDVFPRKTDATLGLGSVLNQAVDDTLTVLTPAFQLCIACGSVGLSAFGRTFVGDPVTAPATGQGFTRTNGKAFTTYSGAIAGTNTPDELLLFQKEIWGGAGGGDPSFAYSVPVPNGFYQVDLYFSEVFHPGANSRVFDVLLEGNVILEAYDLVNPVKDGLGSNQTAIVRTYYIQVMDGAVDVQIGPASTDNGKLSGLCVTSLPSANFMPSSDIGNLSVNAQAAAGLSLNVSDPENDPLTVTLFGLPASLSYNAATGEIEGTALSSEVGTYTINAIVTDGNSSPVTEEFTLEVLPPAGDNPPTIAAIADVQVNEGDVVNVAISVTDDFNPAATIEIYDKSNGGTNNPFTPSTAVNPANYTFVNNGGGSYQLVWNTATGDGRAYEARVTANDGVNPPVTETFSIDIAQHIPGTILARSFGNPLPWYGSSQPQAPFSVAIENNAAQNIGYIDSGDFVEYLVNVTQAGDYDLTILAGKGVAGTTTVSVSESGTPLGSVGVVDNGGWQSYNPYTTPVTFATAGLKTLRLDFNGGANITQFEFIFTGGPAPDTVPPVITLLGNNQIDLFVGDPYVEPGATALDDVDGDISANIVIDASAVDVSTLGSYNVTYNVSDAAGNPATEMIRVVNVNSPPPAASCNDIANLDLDGDGSVNAVDLDDDGDGILDVNDVFALDVNNGTTTNAPVVLDFTQEIPNSLLCSGFTGMMTNGTANYLNQFNPNNITVDYAAGLLTISLTADDAGDAFTSQNTQNNGFQFGVNVPTQPFTIHTRMQNPFPLPNSISQFQAAGLQFGDGTQSNFLKFVIGVNGSNVRAQRALELANSAAEQNINNTAAIRASSVIDLYVDVDPATGLATPRYELDGVPVAAAWTSVNVTNLLSSGVIAVGLISTTTTGSTSTTNGNPFTAVWELLEVTTSASTNTDPVVTITAPADGASLARGTNVPLSGTALDIEDGDISATLEWSSDDPQVVFDPVNGIGSSILGLLVRPGATEITAGVTDAGGSTVTESITVNVSSPELSLTAPASASSINGPQVTLQWTATDVIYSLTEHFHLYVNPADPANLDPSSRISTASQPGQTTWDLGLADGIVSGTNTVYIFIADQFHQEFQNPGASDTVTFTVVDNTPPVITLLGDNPLNLTLGSPYVEEGATANDDFDGDISANIVIDASGVNTSVAGTYQVTYNVSDVAGNAATEVIRTVEVLPAASADVFFVVNPATQTVNENDVFSATVQVQANTQQVDLVEIHLTFNPAVLQVQALTVLSATELPVGLIAPTFDNTAGTIDFAAGNFGPGFPSGTFDLLEISFQAVGGPSTDVDFILTGFPVTIATFGFGNVLTGTTKGEVNVIEDPKLVINPTNFNETVAFGGNTTNTFTVTTNDGGLLPGDLAVVSTATWLIPNAGNDGYSLDATGLTAGNYSASLIASGTGYDNAVATVDLTVQPELVPGFFMAITPGAGLGASTFGANSFQLLNTGDVDIVEVSIDLSTAILPDMVWDPVGTGGDVVAKCLIPDAGAAVTGFLAPADPCTTPFSVPRQGGFDVMTFGFGDFDPGESFNFSVDVDPNSIQGVAGSGDAGSVSGYEMVGATVTVTFADGTTLVGNIFEEGSLGGGNISLVPSVATAPTIALQGNPGSEIIVGDVNQIMTVTGTPGEVVTLLQMDSRLFIASGNPPFNVPDTTFYANEAMSGKGLYSATIGAGGTVDIPVTLLKTPGPSGTVPGGKNRFIAVTTPGPYANAASTSQTSNVIVVKYDPGVTGIPAAIVQVLPNSGLTSSTFSNNSFQILNTGTMNIVSVSIDLSTTFLPNIVFDPVGTGGDATAKCLTPNATVGSPGFLVLPDLCEDPFSQPHNGIDNDEGYDVINLSFTSFNAGEQFNFSVDVDPLNIKGATQTGDAGAISGAELIGATVTITFADGTTLTRCLFEDGSLGGSKAVITTDNLPAPTISVMGIPVTPATTSSLAQTVNVSGPAGAPVMLLQWDARLFVGSSGGYNVSPFDANDVMAKVIYLDTLDANGLASIPVTLLETASSDAGPNGGLNHLMAVVADTSDLRSCLSNVVVLEVIPSCAVAAQNVEFCDVAATGVDLTNYENAITIESGTFAYSIGGTPVADPSSVNVVDGLVVEVLFSGANGCIEPTTISFTVNSSDTTNVSATTCDPLLAGTTQITLTNQFGCDSVVVTTTVFSPADTTILTETTCDPALAGVTQANFTNQFGCDSLVVTTTTLLPSDTVNVAATTCDASLVGLTQVTFSNQFGCDSLVITTTILGPTCDTLTIMVGNGFATTGFGVCIPVTVENFEFVGSGQGTIIWDPTVLSLDEVKNFGVSGLDATSFNEIVPGTLLFAYISDLFVDPNGATLTNGDVLFELCFDAIGANGTSTAVSIVNTPIPIEWSSLETIIPEVIPSAMVSGLVEIVGEIAVEGAAFSVLGDSIPEMKFRLLLPNLDSAEMVKFYSFESPVGLDVEVEASKPTDPNPNVGVTSIDALLINLHILNSVPISNPIGLLAADVNKSGSITSIDRLLVQNFILQNLQAYPPHFTIWRFLPEGYAFADPANPWNVTELRSVFNVQPPLMANENFTGIKLGDVNGNWTPPANVLREANHGEVVMNAVAPESRVGQRILIPITTEQFRNIAAYSFTLSWDPDQLHFESVTNQAQEVVFGLHSTDKGLLPAIWVDEMGQGRNLTDGTVLFEMEFTVLGTLIGGAEVTFGSEIAPSEAYSGDLLRYTLVGNGARLDGTSSISDQFASVLKLSNAPNPFDALTNISFSLPEGQDVDMQIYNGLGQVVWRHSDRFPAGDQKLVWDARDGSGMPVANGVYTLVMTAGPYQASLRLTVRD